MRAYMRMHVYTIDAIHACIHIQYSSYTHDTGDKPAGRPGGFAAAPSATASFANYTSYPATNCYPSRGATDVDDVGVDGTNEDSSAGCVRRCDARNRPGHTVCTGFTIRTSLRSDGMKCTCWLRAAIDLGECVKMAGRHGRRFFTYVLRSG